MAEIETTSSALVITLFGPMQALVHGCPLARMRSRKGMWLLALLVLRHNRPIAREWLTGTLWPDTDQSQAFANLRPILSELRNGLGDQSGRLQSPDRHTVFLDLAGADVDALAFDAAVANGSLPELERAAALYRGPLLEGCAEEWVFQERVVRERQCLQALQALGDDALAASDYTRAASFYQRAVHLDPWWDAAQRGWMEALAWNGDRNAALRVYREFSAVLREDPNAAPDDQTTALYLRLRAEARRQPRPTAPAAAAPRPRLTEPAPQAEPPRAVGALPHALTALIGREDECAAVASCLRRSRLVTLTGIGGIGKTRLAAAVAAEIAPEYASGAWFVTLDSLTDNSQVIARIAEALEVKEETGRPLLRSVADRLRGERLLLVLDNCEHLLTACAQAADHLLRECAGVRILATSREALGIMGETAWAVPSLAAPEPAQLPDGRATLVRVLAGYESAQLFVERAQAVQKTFTLTADNALAVAEICTRLGGLPLAIELAAARLRALSPAQIAARLDDHLSLLTGGNRTAPSRQQTLRAMLDWSYSLLSEQERALLARLSVFSGGWTLEAAEDVCAGEGIQACETLDLLGSLADKSLVVFEERASGGRYRLLEMVRQYAAERLETEAVKDRHRDWLTSLAEEAEPHLKGPEQGPWLERLEAERDNMRTALAWSAAAHDGEAGLRLAGALWQFWELRGYYGEGRASLVEALGRDGARRRTSGRARALNAAGVLAFYQGDYEAARVLHEESLAIGREVGDKPIIAWALKDLGKLAGMRGDYKKTRALYDESLAIGRELADKRACAELLNDLGSLELERGDYDAARALHEESLAIARTLSDKQASAWSLLHLGGIANEQGDHASARALYEESLTIFRDQGNKQGVAWAVSGLGKAAFGQANYTTAQNFYEQSLVIFRELGNRHGVSWALETLGGIALRQDQPRQAAELFEESLVIFRELGNKIGAGWALNHLGDAAYRSGERETARSLFAQSLALFRELENQDGVDENLRDFASLCAADKDWERSVRLREASEALREAAGTRLTPAQSEEYDRATRQARIALGEAAFLKVRDEGRALSWLQAADDALEAANGERRRRAEQAQPV